MIADTAIRYERLDYATVDTKKNSKVNVEILQLSKNVQSLLTLLLHGCDM